MGRSFTAPRPSETRKLSRLKTNPNRSKVLIRHTFRSESIDCASNAHPHLQRTVWPGNVPHAGSQHRHSLPLFAVALTPPPASISKFPKSRMYSEPSIG